MASLENRIVPDMFSIQQPTWLMLASPNAGSGIAVVDQTAQHRQVRKIVTFEG
jgi:hypothetical protein